MNFWHDGYEIIRGLFDPSVVRDFLQRELPTIERDYMTATGHFPLATRLSRQLWDPIRQLRFRDMVHDLLGSRRLYMHMPPTARQIGPGNFAAAVPPHRDASYNEHMTGFVTVWAPFTEVDEMCGGVTVYEGSNDADASDTSDRREQWFDAISTSGYHRVHCVPMAPGDVLVFGPRLIHESMPNISDRTRLSVDYRLFGERDSSTKHYLDLQTWNVVAPHG